MARGSRTSCRRHQWHAGGHGAVRRSPARHAAHADRSRVALLADRSRRVTSIPPPAPHRDRSRCSCSTCRMPRRPPPACRRSPGKGPWLMYPGTPKAHLMLTPRHVMRGGGASRAAPMHGRGDATAALSPPAAGATRERNDPRRPPPRPASARRARTRHCARADAGARSDRWRPAVPPPTRWPRCRCSARWPCRAPVNSPTSCSGLRRPQCTRPTL